MKTGTADDSDGDVSSVMSSLSSVISGSVILITAAFRVSELMILGAIYRVTKAMLMNHSNALCHSQTSQRAQMHLRQPILTTSI